MTTTGRQGKEASPMTDRIAYALGIAAMATSVTLWQDSSLRGVSGEVGNTEPRLMLPDAVWEACLGAGVHLGSRGGPTVAEVLARLTALEASVEALETTGQMQWDESAPLPLLPPLLSDGTISHCSERLNDALPYRDHTHLGSER